MKESMLIELGYGIFIVGICVFVQGATLLTLFFWLQRFFASIQDRFNIVRNFFVVISVVWILSIMHLIQAAIWAIAYYLLGGLGSYYQALYFSIITMSTVGYGDLTAPSDWRLFGGIEALMGPLLFGWSASFLFGTVNRFYQIRSTGSKKR